MRAEKAPIPGQVSIAFNKKAARLRQFPGKERYIYQEPQLYMSRYHEEAKGNPK